MRLVGDIGGTNARFALCEPGGMPQGEAKLSVESHPGLIEAAESYLDGRRVEEAVFAVATPVLGDQVAFTNSPWRFSIAQAKERLGLDRLLVINDFVAQASAIEGLGRSDTRALKPGEPRPGRPRVVIGPGTGLGVAFLTGEGAATRVLASEAGHTSFSPQDDVQAEILRRLRGEFGHVSVERLLSGPGLLRIANALGEIEGTPLGLDSPKQVTDRAAAGDCPVSKAAVRMFCAILGAAAGNMALTLLADGGVFVTGGLSRNLGPLLDTEALTKGFAAKGRFEAYLSPIPITQVMRPHTGLLGAALYEE